MSKTVTTHRAAQSVYLTDDNKPVAEGDPSARRLLVREGAEITSTELEKYEGAVELVEGKGAKKAAPKGDKVQNRDPK